MGKSQQERKDSTLLSLSPSYQGWGAGEKGRSGRGRDLVETPENIRRGGGRWAGGGAGTGCRNSRSPRPLVTDPISGLAPALGKPGSRASLQGV